MSFNPTFLFQDYDGETFKLEEGHTSLSAFQLAALVQNGFPTTTLFSIQAQQELDKLKAEEDLWISSDESIPWTDSKIASYNSAQKLFRCNECECVGFLSRVAEHWLGTHANLRVFQCPQCPYASAWARCVRMHLARQHNICPDPNQESLTLWKENPVLEEVTKYLERLKNAVEGEQADQKDDSEGETHAISTQTSASPPISPEDQQSLSPSHHDQDSLQHHEMQDQELQEHELHQQELERQELLRQQEMDEEELQQHELEQQQLKQEQLEQQQLEQHLEQQQLEQHQLEQQQLEQEELEQQHLEQQQLEQHHLEHQHQLEQQEYEHHQLELQQQEMHQQDVEQDMDDEELQQHELQETQVTHIIEEHIQVPEEVANQLQQIVAAQHGNLDGHPQLQIVITQQENQDLPPTIQIQIAPSSELSPQLVSTSQQTLPLQQVLQQSLSQVIAQAQSVSQPVTQQIIVQQQPQLVQTTSVQTAEPQRPAPNPQPKIRSRQPQSDSSCPKRYNCTVCNYATDRRDLYTRHENIHRDEKPFHCYHCEKQFNRADHVKKHFLRMHRDVPYDINKIRRTITKHTSTSTSTIQYFPKAQPKPAPLPPVVRPTTTIVRQIETVTVNESVSDEYPKLSNDEKKALKKKLGEKRYTCCYCTWTGVDNWCLKRHLNTHLKPFTCTLCDYKAARSERLSTHVFKVHNKKACLKCNFLGEDQTQLTLHQQQNHP